MEDNMLSRLVSGGVLGALAGAAMLVVSTCGPSSAFTLSSPSLKGPVASAGFQQVYYYYRHSYRRCWWMTWGVRRCYWYLGSIKMIAGKSGKWRHVADVAAHHPREVADRLLASGERVEVAHRRRLCSDRGSLKRRRDAAMAAPLALWDPRSNRLNHRRT